MIIGGYQYLIRFIIRSWEFKISEAWNAVVLCGRSIGGMIRIFVAWFGKSRCGVCAPWKELEVDYPFKFAFLCKRCIFYLQWLWQRIIRRRVGLYCLLLDSEQVDVIEALLLKGGMKVKNVFITFFFRAVLLIEERDILFILLNFMYLVDLCYLYSVVKKL